MKKQIRVKTQRLRLNADSYRNCIGRCWIAMAGGVRFAVACGTCKCIT